MLGAEGVDVSSFRHITLSHSHGLRGNGLEVGQNGRQEVLGVDHSLKRRAGVVLIHEVAAALWIHWRHWFTSSWRRWTLLLLSTLSGHPFTVSDNDRFLTLIAQFTRRILLHDVRVSVLVDLIVFVTNKVDVVAFLPLEEPVPVHLLGVEFEDNGCGHEIS